MRWENITYAICRPANNKKNHFYWVTESRMTRWAGYVACMEMGPRWQDNMNVDSKEESEGTRIEMETNGELLRIR
jgi:hypothetical protein